MIVFYAVSGLVVVAILTLMVVLVRSSRQRQTGNKITTGQPDHSDPQPYTDPQPYSDSSERSSSMVLIVLGAVFILAGGAVVVFGMQSLLRALNSTSWPIASRGDYLLFRQ